jgi:hypothetical protein
MLSVAPFGKRIWCRVSPLREKDITHGPGLIIGHVQAHAGQTLSSPLNMTVNAMLLKYFKNFFTEVHHCFISQ